MGERAFREYARLSPTPDGFAEIRDGILAMWSAEPNFTAADLASIAVPTAIVAWRARRNWSCARTPRKWLG
jgi:hypothetical protein